MIRIGPNSVTDWETYQAQDLRNSDYEDRREAQSRFVGCDYDSVFQKSEYVLSFFITRPISIFHAPTLLEFRQLSPEKQDEVLGRILNPMLSRYAYWRRK